MIRNSGRKWVGLTAVAAAVATVVALAVMLSGAAERLSDRRRHRV